MKSIYKTILKTTADYYGVEFVRHYIQDVSCHELESSPYHVGIKKGDRIRIVSGRKYPIGTEGTVKWCGSNKFGYTFNDAISGREIHCDPSIRLILDNGEEIWTHGDVCINLSYPGVDGIHEFKTEEEADAWEKETRNTLPAPTEDVWVYDDNGIHQVGYMIYGLGSKTWGVYQGKLYEDDSVVAAVIDDWVTDTYKFVSFKKVREPDNLMRIVSTGSRRDWDDPWRGDTGLGDALKAFDEFVKEKKAA